MNLYLIERKVTSLPHGEVESAVMVADSAESAELSFRQGWKGVSHDEPLHVKYIGNAAPGVGHGCGYSKEECPWDVVHVALYSQLPDL